MIEIRVPASSANLGPGFDTLGLALDLFLSVRVRRVITEHCFAFTGRDTSLMPDNETNLILRSALHTAQKYGASLPYLSWEIDNQIPIGKGLGSSAAAILAGVWTANIVCDLRLHWQSVLDIAAELEGHPENVCAANNGGLVVACMDTSHVLATPVPISSAIHAILAVPDYRRYTHELRKVVPTSYARADVIFNLQRATSLILALQHPQEHCATVFMEDRLHQPYRAPQIPGLHECLQLKTLPGLVGIALSGSGSTILALAIDHADTIGREVQRCLASKGVTAEVLHVPVNHSGVEIAVTCDHAYVDTATMLQHPRSIPNSVPLC